MVYRGAGPRREPTKEDHDIARCLDTEAREFSRNTIQCFTTSYANMINLMVDNTLFLDKKLTTYVMSVQMGMPSLLLHK